jgi:hypothetical protein
VHSGDASAVAGVPARLEHRPDLAGFPFSVVMLATYLRDFFNFAILIARTFFIILRSVALSADESIV